MLMPKVTYALFLRNGLYGILVRSTDAQAEAAELTADADKAAWLLELLKTNTVYPENLYEILDVLLGVELW